MTQGQAAPHVIHGPLGIDTQMGGVTVEHDGAGHFTFSLDAIREVGLASLADVVSHDIVHVAGLVSHRVQLVRGGQVNFAFNQAGQVVELSGIRAKIEMTSEHRLSIRALDARGVS